MARASRIEYGGAIYRVVSRGDRGRRIFRDDQDREQFLATLVEAGQKTGWQVHAWCVLPDQFQLVIETPQPNLVAGMKWLLGRYTGGFKRRHRARGHVFSGRYQALLVDGSEPGYLKTACDYVHLKPAWAGLIRAEQPLRVYRWSSFPDYLKPPEARPAWLRVDRLLAEHRIGHDSVTGRLVFAGAVEARRGDEHEAAFKRIGRGWCLGGRAFKQAMLQRARGQALAGVSGSERGESQAARAEALVQEELRRRGWTEQDLAARLKGDLEKIRLAQRLREETVATLGWIAQRLRMGSVGYLNNRLYLLRKGRLGARASADASTSPEAPRE